MSLSESIQKLRYAKNNGDNSSFQTLFAEAVEKCASPEDFDKLLWWAKDISEACLTKAIRKNSTGAGTIMARTILPKINDELIAESLFEWLLIQTESVIDKIDICRTYVAKTSYNLSVKKCLLLITDEVRTNPKQEDYLALINEYINLADPAKAIDLLSDFSHTFPLKSIIEKNLGAYIEILARVGEIDPKASASYCKQLATKADSFSTDILYSLIKVMRKTKPNNPAVLTRLAITMRNAIESEILTKKEEELTALEGFMLNNSLRLPDTEKFKALKAAGNDNAARKCLEKISHTINRREKHEPNLKKLIVAGRILKEMNEGGEAEKCRDISLKYFHLESPSLRLIYDTFFSPQYNWEKLLVEKFAKSLQIRIEEELLLCFCCCCGKCLRMEPRSMHEKCYNAEEPHYFYIESKVEFDGRNNAGKLRRKKQGNLDVRDAQRPETIYLDALYCEDCADEKLLGPFYFDEDNVTYESGERNTSEISLIAHRCHEISSALSYKDWR